LKADTSQQELHSIALQLSAGELPPGWDIVTGSPLSRVAFNAQSKMYFKEFRLRSPLHRLAAALRGGRASRARKQNEALRYVGIDTPRSLALGSLPGGREYLFTEAVEGQDVATWLKSTLAGSDAVSLALRRQLLRSLGVFVGRVHATGFLPGDLKASSIQATLVDERFRFTLTDNERTTKQLPPPGRMLLHNLMQLNLLPPSVLSRTDRMRFFVGWRRQLRELSLIEAKVVAAESYLWAMDLMAERGQL
jgi:hypothetical protein